MAGLNSKLPVLPLPHPTVLMPASRLSMPIPRQLGEALLALIEDSDSLPVVAVVPVASTTDTILAEWGTAARVVRLVRPPARNIRQNYLVSLHGLTRVRLTSPFTPSVDHPSLAPQDIEYPSTERLPSRDLVEKFKHSAMLLLDRLARDSVQPSRREGYHKIAAMVDDITDSRASWMADMLIGTINGEFSDKLGT